METNSSVDTETPGTQVTDLLEQRLRIQSWLDNLQTVGSEAKAAVVERVRADYEVRLASILDELAGHLESIRSDRETRREELADASRRFESATEALEEARLRHLIGEIDDDEWRERQPELEGAVNQAEADRENADAEVQRLDDLLQQIEGEEVEEEDEADGEAEGELADEVVDELPSPVAQLTDAAPGTPDAEEAESAAAAEEVADRMVDLDEAGAVDVAPEIRAEDALGAPVGSHDDDLTIVHSPDPLAFLTELPESDEVTVEQPAEHGDDADFLRDLDRAIAEEGETAGAPTAGSEEVAPGGPGTPGGDDLEQYRPTPGTKCPECGYTNDPEAWYCGVCGVDLA